MKKCLSGMAALLACVLSTTVCANPVPNPMRVTIPSVGGKTMVTLTNDDRHDHVYQLTANDWRQGDNGAMTLQPTTDLRLSASKLSIAAGHTEAVWLESVTPRVAAKQLNYRVSISALDNGLDLKGGAIPIHTTIDFPVFVGFINSRRSIDAGGLAIREGRLAVGLSNSGQGYVRPAKIGISARRANGEEILSSSRDGWYILAGDKLFYELDLKPLQCGSVSVFKIMVTYDDNTVQTLDQPADHALCYQIARGN